MKNAWVVDQSVKSPQFRSSNSGTAVAVGLGVLVTVGCGVLVTIEIGGSVATGTNVGVSVTVGGEAVM
jgi:hypothetical protein